MLKDTLIKVSFIICFLAALVIPFTVENEKNLIIKFVTVLVCSGYSLLVYKVNKGRWIFK